MVLCKEKNSTDNKLFESNNKKKHCIVVYPVKRRKHFRKVFFSPGEDKLVDNNDNTERYRYSIHKNEFVVFTINIVKITKMKFVICIAAATTTHTLQDLTI